MKTTIKLIFMLTAVLLLFTGCGESSSKAEAKAAPAPEVSKALPYEIAREEAGMVGRTGYVIAEYWIVVDPAAGDHTALAQTAIKAAMKGLAKHKSNSCRVFVLASPADIGTGRTLARAMYVPSGKGADGKPHKRWDVCAIPKSRSPFCNDYAVE